MFRSLTPANDLDLPLRHQCADRAPGGADRCRAVSLRRPTARPARCQRCARPARSRCVLRRGRLQALDQRTGNSPVSEADIAVNDFLQRSCLRWSRRPAGCRRKPRTTCARRAMPARLDRRSDRRHPRLHRRPRDWSISVALVEDGRPVAGRAFRAGDRRVVSAMPASGATRQRRADRGQAPADSAQRRQGWPGRKRLLDRAGAADCPNRCRSPKCIRWRCGSRASRRRARCRHSPRGNSHDWDLAAADLLVHEAGGAMTDLDRARR